MDADDTLSAADASKLYWLAALDAGTPDLLKPVFKGAKQYKYEAFLQVTLLYEESANDALFDQLCERVADLIKIHPQFKKRLQEASETRRWGRGSYLRHSTRVGEGLVEIEPSLQDHGHGRYSFERWLCYDA